jgi:DNA-binding phage protein
MSTSRIDTSRHRRLLDEQLKDPEFRAEFVRAETEIAQVDAIINMLDQLRADSGRTKAELARQIGKQPAVIRRLFTAEVNPELRTIVALASALDAEIRIVPRRRSARVRPRTYAAAARG